jgi:phosphatidylglycerophosphatase A
MATKPSTEAQPVVSGVERRPRVAYALATSLGVGYLKPGPGTWGSVVGLITAVLCAVFFLRPATLKQLFSLHPLTDAFLAGNDFVSRAADSHNSAVIWPLLCALLSLIFLVAVGVWSAGKVARYSRVEDPQFVVIDEVAGQHLTLLLPLIPIALPHLTAHFDPSEYTIFFALSLVNWKYLLLGFILFRVFDIWKPYPIRRLESLPGGWGIMADDWMAGVYAAILLRLALHFNLV